MALPLGPAPDPEAIRSLLGGSRHARIFERARGALERTDGEPTGSISLAGLDADELVGLAGLISAKRTPQEGGRLAIARLDAALRASRLGCGIRDAVEALGGPIALRRAERTAATEARDALWSEAFGDPLVAADPALAIWLGELRRTGLVRRLGGPSGREEKLLQTALDVLRRLDEPRSLERLATAVTGDAHALDDGMPLATLVLKAVAARTGLPFATDAESRRELWSAAGVAVDDLASVVLVAGLRLSSADPLARAISGFAESGQPARLTLRTITGLVDVGALRSEARTVYVCENPSVVRAAVEAVPDLRVPLIATEGQPSTAARLLLRTLREQGVTLRYHGDFDWPGLRIARLVIERVGARPWRFRASDYRAAVGRSGAVLRPLVGDRAASPWDPALAAAMAERGLAVFEEQTIEALIDDLSTASRLAIDPILVAGERAASMPSAAGAGPTVHEPTTSADWDTWISPTRTRAFALGDPLLDWLGRHGRERGFVPDDERDGFDPRTDFGAFVRAQGERFEAAVVALFETHDQIVRIATEPAHSRSRERLDATLAAMRAGVPIIAGAVLRDEPSRTYGVADLLVRSDVLARLFPDAIPDDDVAMGAPLIGAAHHHYRVVDIKFHTFEVRADGSAGEGDSLPYLVQVWLYNRMLGRLQGYRPKSAYLLGRNWTARGGDERGGGCLERLARVDEDRWLDSRDLSLKELALRGVDWIRRLRAGGAGWDVVPRPSVPELYPHLRNTEDAPWHAAKAEIGSALGELTVLPRMNSDRRALAHAAGIQRWDEPGLSAAQLGITTQDGVALCNAVLAANQSLVRTVLPGRVGRADPAWRTAARVEFFVDFETVNNLGDDFTRLPAMGGQALIFQIGCGWFGNGAWQFAQWTAERLDPAFEGRIIEAWLATMGTVVADAGATLADARIIHWSPAEPVNLETAYNAARTRHAEAAWPIELPWFDFLSRVVRAEPVSVTGAFNFGLKSIAKAMRAAGLIETTWGDGPTDGLGAMVGAWWCDGEARRTGVPMTELELMREIGAYNEVDCRVMAEVVGWLRAYR